MSNDTVNFTESYKNTLYYENDRVKIECCDYRYSFEPVEKITDLTQCESFTLTEKD